MSTTSVPDDDGGGSKMMGRGVVVEVEKEEAEDEEDEDEKRRRSGHTYVSHRLHASAQHRPTNARVHVVSRERGGDVAFVVASVPYTARRTLPASVAQSVAARRPP